LFALPVLAQETTETPEPATTETFATEIPFATPTEVAVETTREPSESTFEVTAEPEITPESEIITLEPQTITPDSRLPLFYSATLDTGIAPELLVQGEWLPVITDTSSGIQPVSAFNIGYQTQSFGDVELEVRLLLADGTIKLAREVRTNNSDGTVVHSGYSLTLQADGLLTLSKDGQPANSAQVTLPEGVYITLRLSLMNGQINAYLNDVLALSVTDNLTTTQGFVFVESASDSRLRLDNLAIYSADLPLPTATQELVPIQEISPILPTDVPERSEPVVSAQSSLNQIIYNFNQEQDAFDWTLRSWEYDNIRGLLYALSDGLTTLDALTLSNASLSLTAQLGDGAFRIYGRMSYPEGGDVLSAYIAEYNANGSITLIRNGIPVVSTNRQLSPGRYVLGLEMLNGQINAYLNGEPVLSYVDSQPLSGGVFGLQFSTPQFSETSFSLYTIDDVTIRATSGSLPVDAVGVSSTSNVMGGSGAVIGGATTAALPPGPFVGMGYLGDRVWLDLDRDGLQDFGEPGIPNVEVQLWSGTQLLASDFTDANGLYSWLVYSDYNYYTKVVRPQGFIFTNPDMGYDNTTDSDGWADGTHPPTYIGSGEVDYTWDFGLFELNSICPGDTTLEIALVLDGSGSIGTTDFDRVRNFAAGLVDSFTIGSTATRFSIVQFSETSLSVIELPLTSSRNTLINEIYTMYYQGGSSTDITRGLNLGQSTLALGRNVQQVPRAVVLFTDGAHNVSGRDPVTEAQLIKDARTVIYTVGVGGYSLSQLNAISSDPDWRHVFTMNNFTELVNSLQSIATNACNTPVVPYIAPTLIDPVNSVRTNDNTPTFTWSVVPYTDVRYDGFYEITIADNSTLTNPLIRTIVTNPTYTPTTLLPQANPQDRTYYWRVIPGNSIGRGPSSQVGTFILDNTPPATPNLNAPASNASLTIAKPGFSWSSVSSGGTTRYRIQIDNNSSFSSPVVDQIVNTASYTPPIPIHQGTNYWRVQAIDQAGNISPWSVVRSFSTNSASTPADDFFLSTTNGAASFSWTSLSGASEIRIQISNSSSFSTLLRNISVPTTTTIHTLSGSNLLPFGIYYWRLAVNVGFGLEPSPFSRKLTVTPPAPPVPTLITADNLLTNNNIPDLEWNAVNYPYPDVTISYRVQISSSSSFSACGSDCQYDDLTNTIFTPPTPLADNLYYWRVKTVNMYGFESAWSATRRFTVDTTPLSIAPILSAPAADALVTTPRPTLRWTAVSGAASYVVHLEDSSGILYELTTTTTSLTIPQELPQDRYMWRVGAIDAANNGILGYGTNWSSPYNFEVNFALTPANNNNLILASEPGPVRFTWTASPNNLFGLYAVEVILTSDGTTHSCASSTTTCTISLPYGRYAWRVQVSPQDRFFNLPQFSVTPSLPSAPTLTSPANAALFKADQDVVSLNWNAVTYNGLPLTYDVEVGNNTFSTIAFSTNTVNTTTVTSNLPEGTYSWRVRAVNLFGGFGPWSAVRTFTVDKTPPAAPNLTAPADSAVVITLTPTFTWATVPTARRYEILLDTQNPPQRTYTVTTTSFTPPSALLANRSYQWRVRAIDAAGNVGNWSVQRSVNIATPTTMAPMLNRYTVASIPLSWTFISWATAYEIQVDDSPTFNSVNFSFITTSGMELSVITTPLANGTYNWRARARNAANIWGPWSQATTFVVDVP
jgi:hypothetical protein